MKQPKRLVCSNHTKALGYELPSSAIAVGLTILAFAFAQMAPATDLYVATNGTGDGSSWANATNDLQGAIDAIAANITNTVWVSNGVYQTGGRTNYPAGSLLTNRVVIAKAITVRSANNDPANTIIKGAGPKGPAAVRGVYISAGSLIGFTVTNGATLTNATGSAYDTRGGGVHGGGTLSNCILTGNSCHLYGGGVYSCTLLNCTIVGNQGVDAGGGAAKSTLYNCTLSSNLANSGGGAFDCLMYNCLLTGNSVGGVRVGDGTAWGPMYNCTIVGNSDKGVYNSGVNMLIVYNSIIYFNEGPDWSGTMGFTNSCTSSNYPGWADGNITNDPLFIANGTGYGTNLVAGNYRLSARSPSVNAGMNFSWMTDPADVRSKDLDGLSRINKFQRQVDMGCYERHPAGTLFSAF